MKEGFVLRKEKVYPLLREEREEVYEFINEQLRKEYIRLLKLPQMIPMFFVGKKDGKKRMVQDYQYLNEWTVKKNYPLPLISDVIKNIGTKKIFMRMDLRWGYNNVRIREEDEWKAAFTTPKGSFEPTVMFFGLTNSPATFQAIINELLRDVMGCLGHEQFLFLFLLFSDFIGILFSFSFLLDDEEARDIAVT